MIIQKITAGFVIQDFDTDKQAFVAQEFVGGDEVTYEVEAHEINETDFLARVVGKEPYLPFEMKQPHGITKNTR